MIFIFCGVACWVGSGAGVRFASSRAVKWVFASVAGLFGNFVVQTLASSTPQFMNHATIKKKLKHEAKCEQMQ